MDSQERILVCGLALDDMSLPTDQLIVLQYNSDAIVCGYGALRQ